MYKKLPQRFNTHFENPISLNLKNITGEYLTIKCESVYISHDREEWWEITIFDGDELYVEKTDRIEEVLYSIYQHSIEGVQWVQNFCLTGYSTSDWLSKELLWKIHSSWLDYCKLVNINYEQCVVVPEGA